MKNLFVWSLILTFTVSCGDINQDTTSHNDSLEIEQKVNELLNQMSLEEKIDQLGGIGFDTKLNDRLGIPTLRMTDGPVGIRWGKATALPAAVSLASSWDQELMYEVGKLIGKEAKVKGRNFFLGPCVNIHRFPIGGRNFESFGEDPYLAAKIAVPYIKGVQSENVLACAKHYACNNQEWKRSSINVVVDERTMHEIYLPAFKAAVQEAGVWTVMSSYNKVNGKWTSENGYLLDTVLKQKWGFEGFVVSDWGATHSTVGSALAGLDLEMPWGDHFNDSLLKDALAKNEIDESVIDEKVRRLLRVRFETGMFDESDVISEDILQSEEHKQIAYEAAVNGIVLLKNENNILPINLEKVKKIAVIGPNAAFARVGGGGSSKVMPFYAVSPLEGLKNKMNESVEINYALGTVINQDIQIIESKYFEPVNDVKGMVGDYYLGINIEGEKHMSRNDETVDFLWYYDAPQFDMHGADDGNYFAVRWTGKIKAPETGEYKFQIMHNDGVRFSIDDQLIIDEWEDYRGSKIDDAKIFLEAGKVYDIQLDYYNNRGVSEIKLGWEIPNIDLMGEAVDLARESDLAVVCVGLSDHFEGESRDREFLVLKNQDQLIKKVREVNPNTVVVIISGTPPIIEAWADDVPAIVQAWFGGQEGGNAIADILLGNRNPSGKLPCTFYRSKDDSPGFKDYKDESLQSIFDEGIYVGYRYLDKHQFEARYPFGHGLSYTSFEYGEPTYEKDQDNSVQIRLTITNSGNSAGAEVVQLYVQPVETSVERAEKELKAFKKVELEPGESKEISFVIDVNAFQYYDVVSHDWQVDKGIYNLLIGSSSADIRRVVSGVKIE